MKVQWQVNGTRCASSAARSACSKAERMRRRIAVASSILAESGSVADGMRPTFLLGAAILAVATGVALRNLGSVPLGAAEG